MDKKKVITVNTFYPSVVKQPKEMGPQSLVRKNSLKSVYESNLNIMESIHRKDMKDFEKTRKNLQKSMVEYIEMKERSRHERQELAKQQSVFLTKRPVSLDARLIDTNRQSQEAGGQDGGKTRDALSPRQLNTSDPKNRSVSETLYRENTKGNIGSLPSGYQKPEARSDYLITNAFQYKPSESTSDAYSWLSSSRALTYTDKDSAYESVFGDNESQGVTETGEGMQDPDLVFDISPFPHYEAKEISKHRDLNEEAEKNSKRQQIPNPLLNRLFLQRLRLQRSQLLASRKDVHLVAKKKAPPLKKMSLPRERKDSPKWMRDPKMDSPSLPVRRDLDKPNKVVHSFRYSYAIEDYFRRRARRASDASSMTEFEEEVKGGWIVKPLGAKVLNTDPRFLPSVSPQQRRLRARLRQAQLLEGRQDSKSVLRMRSTDSLAPSRASSHEPQMKSQVMESIPEEKIKEKVKKKEVHFHDTEHDLQSGSKTSVESQTILPDIQISASRDDHVVQLTHTEQQHGEAKASYLSLPAISVEG